MRALASRIAMAGVIVTALCAGAPGCSAVSSGSCAVAPLTVSSDAVQPGGSLVLSSAAAGCDLGYEAGHRYEVSLLTHGSSASEMVASVPVNGDGLFEATITVPEDFPLGEASFLVNGTSLDEARCDDGESCAAYVHAISIVG